MPKEERNLEMLLALKCLFILKHGDDTISKHSAVICIDKEKPHTFPPSFIELKIIETIEELLLRADN